LLRRRPTYTSPPSGRTGTAELDLREEHEASAGRRPEPPVAPATYGPSPVQALLRRLPGRFIALALALAIIAGGVGALLVELGTRVYQTQASLMVDQPLLLAADTGPATIDKLGAVRLKYADLVETQPIASAVAHQVGMSPAAVASSLFANAPQGSLLLNVGARSTSPAIAVRLTRAASSALIAYANAEQDTYKVPTYERIVLSQMVPAPAATRVSPENRRAAEVGVAAAVIAFLVVAFAAFVTRPVPIQA